MLHKHLAVFFSCLVGPALTASGSLGHQVPACGNCVSRVPLEAHAPSEVFTASTIVLPPQPTNWTVGSKRLLFMRLIFPDDASEPITSHAAASLMSDVGRWYAEKSYGMLTLTSEVTPLLQMPQPKTWYGMRPMTRLLEDARTAAAQNGFDPATYDLDIARFTPIGGWDFGGSATVGGKGLWLQSSSLSVVIHELGHNLGLEHANFWAAGADSIIGPGSHVDYGNIFDIMGAPPSNLESSHFNVCWLNRLGWLGNGSIATVTTSGVYRLHAFDLPGLASGAIHALRIRKDSGRDYWAEFRQKFTGNPWTQNGILLNWSPWQNSRFGTHLLDTTPGSPSATNDAPLVIGCTLSDFQAGIHITPLAVYADESGRSIDVQVHLGTFSNNVAPTLSVLADQIAVGAGEPVQLTATAADADGDALAYRWDFGDFSFGSNAPVVFKTWQQSGVYAVRCTVSDMKGGLASRNLIITVGAPAAFQISGRITDALGNAITAVRVHNGAIGAAYRAAYTDSDGYYSLVNLSAGNHTLAAVKYGFNFAPNGWGNPISVGPNNPAGADWTASPYPSVSVAATDPSATESETGPDTATFTMTRLGSLDFPITVKFDLTGTAELDYDYTLSAGADTWPYAITLPAGIGSTNIVLRASDEFDREGTETVILTLLEDVGYTIATNSATIAITDSIGKILPYVEWENPADITYGTPLGPDQLNAFTFDEGTLTYEPPAGTVLDAGTHQLSVVFTPDDPLRYESATNYVVINVAKKSLTVTADDITTVHGAPLLFTASYNGFVNGDTPAVLDVPPSFASDAVQGSDVGFYGITVSGGSDANYSMSFFPGTLTITRANTIATLISSSNPAPPGQAVTFTFTLTAAAPSTAIPDGLVRFRVDSTPIADVPLQGGIATFIPEPLSYGSHTISAEYSQRPNFAGAVKAVQPDQLMNNLPIARDDLLLRSSRDGAKIKVTTLLNNDSDSDGRGFAFILASPESAGGGAVSRIGDWIYYAVPSGLSGNDYFTYTISDEFGEPVVGTVNVVPGSDSSPSNVSASDLGNGQVRVRFNGIPGLLYRVQYSEPTAPDSWQPLGNAVANDVGQFEILDTMPLGSPPRRYRSLSP